MQQRTSPPVTAVTQGGDPRPADIAVMRETARRLLSGGEVPPLVEDVTALSVMLRGHVELLVPEIEALLPAFPVGDVPAAIARVGVEEASRRLNTPQGPGTDAAYRQAKKLAMSVFSLCDHYENLRGARVR